MRLSWDHIDVPCSFIAIGSLECEVYVFYLGQFRRISAKDEDRPVGVVTSLNLILVSRVTCLPSDKPALVRPSSLLFNRTLRGEGAR